MKDADEYYANRVEQELKLAAAAVDKVVKAVHLDMAARYATLRERNSAARGAVNAVSTSLDGAGEAIPSSCAGSGIS